MRDFHINDAEVAALDVSSAQAKVWLQRQVDEGVIEKQKTPAGHIIKPMRLFEQTMTAARPCNR